MKEVRSTRNKLTGMVVTISIVCCSLVVLIPLLMIFWPIIIPDFSHSGVEQYCSGRCFNCDHGKEFSEIVSGFDLENHCETIGFEHKFRTFLKKVPYEEIFILDIQSIVRFDELEKRAVSLAKEQDQGLLAVDRCGFSLYLVGRPQSDEYVILAFNKEKSIIRCIYIVSYDVPSDGAVLEIIDHHISWDIEDTKTGGDRRQG